MKVERYRKYLIGIQILACILIFIGAYFRCKEYAVYLKEYDFYYVDLYNILYCLLMLAGSIAWLIYIKNRREKACLTAHVIITFAVMMNWMDMLEDFVFGIDGGTSGIIYTIPAFIPIMSEMVLITSKYKEVKYKNVIVVVNTIIKIFIGAVMLILILSDWYGVFGVGVSITFVVIMLKEVFLLDPVR